MADVLYMSIKDYAKHVSASVRLKYMQAFHRHA